MYLKNFKPLSKKGILFGTVLLVFGPFVMNAIIPESKKINSKSCIDFLQSNNLHGTCTTEYPTIPDILIDPDFSKWHNDFHEYSEYYWEKEL